MASEQDKEVVIIGAGPAGLTAAYELTKHHFHPLVLEQHDKVGGIARTESYKGYHFDMGGHRFYTKVKSVQQMWQEILGPDFLRRPRLSRIYYRRKFFHYPLQPLNALFGLGIWQAILIILSFIRWQLRPYPHEDTFEQWVTNRFGQRLFETFFKTYTEKVWGVPCSELKAEMAAQRIKDLCLKSAVLSMFIKPKVQITTLIEEFHYPRLGPGMMWNEVKNAVIRRGGAVALNCPVVRICRTGNHIDSVVVACDGRERLIQADHVISSMPLTEFITRLDPAPVEVLAASQKLTYRDFLTVCLIIKQPDLFPDNWIYIHAPEVKVGRIQNFKNWSADMVPDQAKTSLGLEYFCTQGDEIWNLSDAELVELGKQEVARIGLADYDDIEDGCVFRVPKAYPVYDNEYRGYLEVIKRFLAGLDNYQSIGRNGLHRYNNQDHSMLTGMLAARNIALGERNDLWSVNAEKEYLEEVRQETAQAGVAELLEGVLTKLDPVALGLAVGVTTALMLFFATMWLVVKGGDMVGPNLQLLSQFFPGYRVDLPGAIIGSLYMSLVGFTAGWGFAFLRNAAVALSALLIHRDLEWQLVSKLLDSE